MKILYFSCHEILEYDEIRILRHAGHQVYSIGAYSSPDSTGHLRHLEADEFRRDMWALAHETGCSIAEKRITSAFAGRFDAFLIMHDPADYFRNQDVLTSRRVFMRTIGQSTSAVEQQYLAMPSEVQIVRYSASERSLPARTDAVIYFGKFVDEFQRWRGIGPGVTFHNNIAARSYMSFPNLSEWAEFQGATGADLYGSQNDGTPGSKGIAAPEAMADIYANASYYAFCYTARPSYTLSFMEALLSGLPVIAPSPRFIAGRNDRYTEDDLWTEGRYEIASILAEGGGLTYDSIAQAAYLAGVISVDREKSFLMSKQARSTAERLFCANKAAFAWNNLLYEENVN